MLDPLIPWLAAVFSLLLAYPWARWLLDRSPAGSTGRRDPVLALLLTVALSVGALTWLLLMLSAVSPGLATFWPATGLALILSALGVVARRRTGNPVQAETPDSWWRQPLPLTAALVILGLAGLTLLNAASWPFFEDDTMALYGPMAYRFAETGQFTGLGLYDAYPVLTPLAMAYPGLAAGALHEYAARFVTAVQALGTIGTAYVLGRDLFDRRVGLAAAFLLATVPIVPHWAAAAYTDLPAGFYYGLAVIFAWRLYTIPHPVHALLTGLMAGLAAFTKNGALLLAGSLAGWIAYSTWRRWRDPAAPGAAIGGRSIALMIGGYLLTAGPWYLHTLIAYGHLVPPTGWVDQATHTLTVLFGPALAPGHFLLGGPLGFLGLAAMLWALWRSRWAFAPRPALLVGFSVPFWLVWWWYFSYDLRFLLMVWPLFTVMGGQVTLAAWDRLAAAFPAPAKSHLLKWGPLKQGLLPLALLILALPAARQSVDHKLELLRDPFMDDAARHRVQQAGLYDVALWLRAFAPADAPIIYYQFRLSYYLMQSHPDAFRAATYDETTIRRFAYWVTSPGQTLPAWAEAAGLRPVYESGGYAVYDLSSPGNEAD